MSTTTMIAAAEAPSGAVSGPVRSGPVNNHSAEEILALLQDHALRLGFSRARQRQLRRGACFILQ